jgi:DNA-binding LacI/PurR family transcriptional regulator
VEQGQQGTRMLLDELAGASGAVRSMLAPHNLVVRESTGPPPN